MSLLPRRFLALPAPTHCPAPDPAYPLNEGAEIARVALIMGIRLQPWQRLVLNRATQYRWGANALGARVREYKYKTVVVTVPRQSGKTTLVGPLQVFRMLLRPGSKSLYTAQTGADASERIRELITSVIESPLREIITPRYSSGSEGLTVRETGSTLRRFSPTLSAVHGGHPHLVTLDEIWKFDKTLGDTLVGSIGPSQVTIRQEAQIWMISTKGTARSEFMNELIARGASGADPAMCFIEWSMPEDRDPYDPETWRLFHPALGNTQTPDSLAADATLPYAEWMRGYMNVVVAADDPLIPLEDWDHLAAEPLTRPTLDEVALAYDAGAVGECAAVVAAWEDADGKTAIRVVRQAPGVAWIAPYVAELAAAHPGMGLWADDGGPTRRVTDDLRERHGLDDRITTLTITERGIADGNLLDAITETRQIRHDASRPLRDAIANAATKDTNGIRLLSRDKSTAPIPALIAASVAMYGAAHPAPATWVLP